MRRGKTPRAALSGLERKVIYLSEKKVNRLIKPASLGDAPQKKQDQPLSAAANDTAFIGKISDPIPKPAKRPRTTRKSAEKAEGEESGEGRGAGSAEEGDAHKARAARRTGRRSAGKAARQGAGRASRRAGAGQPPAQRQAEAVRQGVFPRRPQRDRQELHAV